jgi:hypothetical protein
MLLENTVLVMLLALVEGQQGHSSGD